MLKYIMKVNNKTSKGKKKITRKKENILHLKIKNVQNIIQICFKIQTKNTVTLVSFAERESKSKGSLGSGGGLPSRGDWSSRSTSASDMSTVGWLGRWSLVTQEEEANDRQPLSLLVVADGGGGGSLVGKVDGSCCVNRSKSCCRKFTSTVDQNSGVISSG